MSVGSAGGKPATTTQLASVMIICSNYHNVVMSRRRIRIFIAWLWLIVKKTASGSYKILLCLLATYPVLARYHQHKRENLSRAAAGFSVESSPNRTRRVADNYIHSTPGLTLRLRKAFLTIQSKHREPATKLKLCSAEFTPIAGWEPLKQPKGSSFFNHLHKVRQLPFCMVPLI